MTDISSDQIRQLRGLLEQGLPLAAHPYRALAAQCGLRETQVLDLVWAWQHQGLFRRVGLVVQHRRLGIQANLMLVLDIEDAEVDAVGASLGAAAGVTLCYRRRRHLPDWPYNLFCMIHGRDRVAVQRYAQSLLQQNGLSDRPHAFLFSSRAYKQRGACYTTTSQERQYADLVY